MFSISQPSLIGEKFQRILIMNQGLLYILASTPFLYFLLLLYLKIQVLYANLFQEEYTFVVPLLSLIKVRAHSQLTFA